MASRTINLQVDASQALADLRTLQGVAEASPEAARAMRAFLDTGVLSFVLVEPAMTKGDDMIFRVRLANELLAHLPAAPGTH